MNYNIVSGEATLLDGTTHACASHNVAIAITVPNLSDYRYVMVIGTCGDTQGDFSLMYVNCRTSSITQFVTNISNTSWLANAKITCDFRNNIVALLPQLVGWNANTISIKSIYGILPIE